MNNFQNVYTMAEPFDCTNGLIEVSGPSFKSNYHLFMIIKLTKMLEREGSTRTNIELNTRNSTAERWLSTKYQEIETLQAKYDTFNIHKKLKDLEERCRRQPAAEK